MYVPARLDSGEAGLDPGRDVLAFVHDAQAPHLREALEHGVKQLEHGGVQARVRGVRRGSGLGMRRGREYRIGEGQVTLYTAREEPVDDVRVQEVHVTLACNCSLRGVREL